ncbi:hypothetical protein HD554DRAFT_2108975 [Boletus coccyginus]|nr:hypothetical protein HD554DRAFT_2108975 [Boletus coccyginus]
MSRRLADKIARPVYHQFVTSSRLRVRVRPRLRHLPPPFLRRLALSYSSIPRSFRTSIAVIIVGAVGIGYVNYRIKTWAAGWVTAVQDAATGLVKSASDGVTSVPARVPTVKLPDETLQFLKGLFSGRSLPAVETPQFLKDIFSGRVPPVKPPPIETPQFFKDLFTSYNSARHDRGSSSQDLKNDSEKTGSKG